MMTPLCREYRLIVLAVISWVWAAGVASAQTPDQPSMTTPTLAVMKAHVPVGDVVYVTDTTGATIIGELAALTGDAVQLKIRPTCAASRQTKSAAFSGSSRTLRSPAY
jgi:hypothetical protein